MALLVTTLVAGRTKKVGPYTITLNGNALDLSGYTVTMVMRTKGGTIVASPGTITLADNQATTGKGQIYWTPPATGLDEADSPYLQHFKLVDGVGDVFYVPKDEPGQIVVWTP
jgi:hypothetical protein